jgi:two-component system response regulator FixJ
MGGSRRVYIVDDNEGVRDSLRFQLETAGFAVKDFASGLDFLRYAETLAPGCVILDVRMPEMDGLTVQSKLAELNLNFPVIIMTGHGDVPLAVRAMRAGAIDFLEKPFSEEAILESIRLGQDRAARSSPRRQEFDKAAADRLSSLSPREREVLEGLVAGFPNKTIAYDLGVSARTVESHRARVMDKMQARSLSELVRMVLAAGINVKT